jgi:hypothetical protein
MQIMKTHHTFIDRNFILYKSIQDWESNRAGCLTDEDHVILEEFGLRSSILDGTPDWLIKWAAYICRYIKFEEAQYPTVFRDDYPNVSVELIKLDAKNMRDVKLSMVAVTINKVKHVLEQMKTQDPPFKKLTQKDIYDKFWMADDSFKIRLQELLNNLEPRFQEEVEFCNLFIKTIDDAEVLDNEEGYAEINKQIRYVLDYVS